MSHLDLGKDPVRCLQITRTSVSRCQQVSRRLSSALLVGQSAEGSASEPDRGASSTVIADRDEYYSALI
jgi:hypothetical protein